jgi:integrase
MLGYNTKHLSPSSLVRYRQSFDCFIDIVGSDLKIQDLNSEVVDYFSKVRMERTGCRQTVNIDLRQVQATLRLFHCISGITLEPAHFAKLPYLDEMEKVFTIQEVQRLIDEEPVKKIKNFWHFLVWTGIKKEEALQLQWGNVFERGPAPYMKVTSSSGSVRKVVLVSLALDKLGARKGAKSLVFPSLNSTMVTKEFAFVTKKAGLAGHLINDLSGCIFKWAKGLGIPEREILHFNDVVPRVESFLSPGFKRFSSVS